MPLSFCVSSTGALARWAQPASRMASDTRATSHPIRSERFIVGLPATSLVSGHSLSFTVLAASMSCSAVAAGSITIVVWSGTQYFVLMM